MRYLYVLDAAAMPPALSSTYDPDLKPVLADELSTIANAVMVRFVLAETGEMLSAAIGSKPNYPTVPGIFGNAIGSPVDHECSQHPT